ncbi:prolyl 4-hydroxylase subunit alpha-1 [Drosophila elegans]|uniref:prolyl 4-hydroxylase subunit alpha-1 n=1 Tax=Drosophila elegans TaxID=30023 RepID=UPI0007E6EDB0|nr:prolyl 4-hydroxylase subunit alpha-1 [Drosophila elegans]
MCLILKICLVSLILPGALFEILTDQAMSIAGMKSLVDMEGLFISELTNYANALKDKIDTIESFLQNVQSKREISRKNPQKFVAHPLNGFSLIRRLHEDWTNTELLMSKQVGLSNLEAIKKGLDEAQPTEQDLDDAIRGVFSLHRFYNLQPVDIANGVLGGQKYNAKMSTLDCQVLANSLVNSNRERIALDWYKTAVDHYDEERDGQVYREVFNFTLADLYTNYTETLVAKGFISAALNILRNVSDLDADLWSLHRKIYEYAKADIPDTFFVTEPWVGHIGCQGLWERRKYFSCFYESGRTAFLRIAPLKVEILSLDPYIAIYHDVIYDSEISRMKNISLPLLNGPLRFIYSDDYNLKFAKLNEEHQSALNQRVTDITGENEKGNSDFMIYNYGICGFRDSHVDNLELEDQTAELGDRLTSIMFFLSDVAQGGATVFPYANITIWPQKGSAVVWRNLNHAMQPNEDTFHMSCPVIVGSKWTLVKWLHQNPQMFSRPCEKEYTKFNL